jgi:hypothetical protein
MLATSTRAWCAALLICASIVACGPVPEMVMPGSLESEGDVYAVSGANGEFLAFLFPQRVQFGPYRARWGSGIESGEHAAATVFNGEKEHRSSIQKGWFRLQGPDSDWRGHCVREDRVEIDHTKPVEFTQYGFKIHPKDRPVTSLHTHTLRCSLQNRQDAVLKLLLDLDWAGPGAGNVIAPQGTWSFGPSYEQRNQRFNWATDIAGFVVHDENDRAVGALDTGGRPRVAIQRDLAPARRELLAAICMALIMRRFLE